MKVWAFGVTARRSRDKETAKPGIPMCDEARGSRDEAEKSGGAPDTPSPSCVLPFVPVFMITMGQ